MPSSVLVIFSGVEELAESKDDHRGVTPILISGIKVVS